MKVSRACTWVTLSVLVAAACGGGSDGDGGADDDTGAAGHAGDEPSAGSGGSGSGARGGSGPAAAGEGGSSVAGSAGASDTSGAAGEGGDAASTAGAGGNVGERGSLLPSHAKGSRLAVKEIRSGDMPPAFVSFHDTELGVDCSFNTAVDGSTRCIPQYTADKPYLAPTTFLDADCTVQVAVGDAACVPGTNSYAVEGVTGMGCNFGSSRVFRATQVEPGTDLYTTANGGCEPHGQVSASALHFRAEEMDPEEFVAGEVQLLATPTRLSVRRFVGEDGSYQNIGLGDPRTGERCRVFEVDAGELACVPAIAWSAREYRTSDSECTEPISLKTCDEALTIVDFTEDEEFVFFEAGPVYTGTVYGGTNACDVVEDENSGQHYEIGAALAPSVFPSVTARHVGSGRLQHQVYSDAAGTELAAGASTGDGILSAGGLYDTELEAPCYQSRYTDGELYCIPENVTLESFNNLYYTDADCTEQVAVCGENGCPSDVALMLEGLTGVYCSEPPGFTKVLTLGEEVTPDEVYIFYGGREPGMQCDGPFPTDDFGVIREITGETDVSRFAQLTVSTSTQ